MKVDVAYKSINENPMGPGFTSNAMALKKRAD